MPNDKLLVNNFFSRNIYFK